MHNCHLKSLPNLVTHLSGSEPPPVVSVCWEGGTCSGAGGAVLHKQSGVLQTKVVQKISLPYLEYDGGLLGKG